MSHAIEIALESFSAEAAGDLSSYQYYPVQLNSNEQVILASDAGDECVGILQDDPDTAGHACSVGFKGITKAVGGEAIDAGSKVGIGAGGKLVAYVSGGVVGYAVTACGGDEELFSVLLVKAS